MSEEKSQSAGTATEEAPGENTVGENTVQLTFLPEGKTVQFEHGKLPCTTCHVWIKEGAENLSPMDDDEADRLDMAADLQLNSRLGCQVQITKPGKVVVEIPTWNRNYISEEHH
jgi:2Fe-2S ferredoxin